MEGGAVSASHRHPAVLPRRSRGAVGDPAPRGAHRHAGFPAFRPSAPGGDAAQDGGCVRLDRGFLRRDRPARFSRGDPALHARLPEAPGKGRLDAVRYADGGRLGCVLRLVRSPAPPAFPRWLAFDVVRALVAFILFFIAAVASAEYPARPIRLLVPNPPGGATDTVARLFAPKLGEALGQPVIVENRPGSNGNVAMETVARSAPDGHTLLLGADAQIVIGPHLYAKMPLDTLKDLL